MRTKTTSGALLKLVNTIGLTRQSSFLNQLPHFCVDSFTSKKVADSLCSSEPRVSGMESVTPKDRMKKIVLLVGLAIGFAGIASAQDCYDRRYDLNRFYTGYDLNVVLRRAQIRSEIIDRENRNSRLDQFLLDQGY
jgi:hypothetical protein